ncbi:hypothetical protein [Nocardioides sp. R-C-SC26]|uniref:hypothetical protein n=1 Tax=Nocardioides sp. R-C-SC26 TaxID=2870414 RepID=UPI001E2C5D9A|nr:hypothetical protein [Nocardioides sp. R-C-SC26]
MRPWGAGSTRHAMAAVAAVATIGLVTLAVRAVLTGAEAADPTDPPAASSSAPSTTGASASPGATQTSSAEPTSSETPTTSPTPTPTSEPTASPTTSPTVTPAPADAVEVDDAVLTWAINDESNNKAFAPGTFNFLAAGAVPDPGRGGQTIVAPGVWRGTSVRAWRATSGAVTIQKRRPDGRFAAATFAGLSTAVDGAPLTSTSGPFSGHRVRIGGGSGTVDPTSGSARIDWRGTFSLVYYSGFTFLTVTDPSLVVVGGVGQVRATVAGFAADRSNPDRWQPVPARRVVLADLPRLTLPAAGGITVTPRYLGVSYDAPADAPQVRTGSTWGAFPASFVNYVDRLGSGAFFYSTGGAADPIKVPSPIAVSYDAADPVEPGPTSGPTPTAAPTPTPTTPVNPLPPPPPVQPAPPVLPAPVVPPLPAPDSGEVPSTGATTGVPAAVPTAPPTVYALTAASTSPSANALGGAAWRWTLGVVLLLAAAGLAAVTTVGARRPRR